MSEERREIEVRVDEGDALSYRVDILAVKYAQAYYGLDGAIVKRFSDVGFAIDSPLMPRPGRHTLVSSHGQVLAKEILFLGVVPLREFRYQQIREFSRGVMEALSEESSNVVHLGLTLHGANYGLDEVEAFEAEIAGLIDAVEEGRVPKTLEVVTIIERNAIRAGRLNRVLSELLPSGRIIMNAEGSEREEESRARLRAAGYSSDSKPHVFVAMPFDESMDDVYHYGITGAVRAAGFLCERADETAFTGEVLKRVKQRIKSSTLVVADLSTANANVYLEVGYAWGCGIPTVLIVRDVNELQFDVRNQRCLVYGKIKDLERLLRQEVLELAESLEI